MIAFEQASLSARPRHTIELDALSVSLNKNVTKRLGLLGLQLAISFLTVLVCCAQSRAEMSSYIGRLYGGEQYVGAWKNNRQMQNFDYATSIEFELWQSRTGLPEGVAVFYKGRTTCIGNLAFDSATGELLFTPVEGPICEALTGAKFMPWSPFEEKMAGLQFRPGADYPPKTPRFQSRFYFRRQVETPAKLKAIVKIAKGSSQSISDSIEQSLNANAASVGEMRRLIDQEPKWHFRQSMLIGAWRGELLDAQRRYPIEVAMWSYRDESRHNSHRLSGAVFLGGQRCLMRVEADSYTSYHDWSSTPMAGAADCQPVSLKGHVLLFPDNNRLLLSVAANSADPDYMHKVNCLEDVLRNEEVPWLVECGVAGVLERAQLSSEFKTSLVASNHLNGRYGLASDRWEILQRDDALIAELASAHDAGLDENAEIMVRVREAYKEAQRREERERIARVKQQRAEAAAKQAERDRAVEEWEEQGRTFGRPSSAAAVGHVQLPELPTVRGPFDGLSGENFLNALYHGDIEAISKFDEYYHLRKKKQRSELMGGEHWMDGLLDAATNRVRLADTVLAIYLFNYDSKFGDCLRSDAVTFEVVTTVPETVHTNLLGVEVARSYGSTHRKEFRINREFITGFRRIGADQPESFSASLADVFLNQGDTDLRNQILRGSKEIMNRFDCRSAPIVALERTLLAFSER